MIRWYLGSVAAALAIGWAAAKCHVAGWSPVGLVSLAVGILLGVVVSKLATMAGVCCRKRLVVGTATFALIAILAEHTWLYQDFRRQWVVARASNPQVAMFRPDEPWSPIEYLRHEATPRRVTLWCADAVLIVASAVGVVWIRDKPNQRQFVVADDANNPLTPDL